MNQKQFKKFLDQKTQKQIMELRKSYAIYYKFSPFLSDYLEKVFKRLAIPYLRFELLSNCIVDISTNKQHYPNIDKNELKKINKTIQHLQKICFHLNVALEEFCKALIYIKDI